jgi:hypothetical protein
VARGPDVAKVRSLTELCGLQIKVETYNAAEEPLRCKRCQRFGHTQHNCGYAPRCVACGDAHASGTCVTPRQQLKCCSCGGNHTANYRGCSKWKEAKAATAKRAKRERSHKDGVSTRLPAPKAAPIRLSPENKKLGPGWNHVVWGGACGQGSGFSCTNPHLSRRGGADRG